MHPSASQLSIKDWFDRISPALDSSVQDANDVITNTPAVQEWLQTAAMETASSLGNISDTTAQMQAYRRLVDSFRDQFPELCSAVGKATLGAATVNIDLRLMSPNLTQVELDFGTDVEVERFFALNASGSSVNVASCMDQMEASLPDSDPYPGHPHQIAAVLATSLSQMTVVLEKRTRKDGSSVRQFQLSAPSYETVHELTRTQAEAGVERFFDRESGTTSS